MDPITGIKFLNELFTLCGKTDENIEPSLTMSYELLHEFAGNRVIPLIKQKNITIATVELTTCGLITDLLTGVSGASHFFILGMTPYSNEMKVKLGIPNTDLAFGGFGVVSPEVAKALARRIMVYSGAKIGLAETGLITSSELNKRRTKKKAGEVFAAIASNSEVLLKQLQIQQDLSRIYMRQEIAFRLLEFLYDYLTKLR